MHPVLRVEHVHLTHFDRANLADLRFCQKIPGNFIPSDYLEKAMENDLSDR